MINKELASKIGLSEETINKIESLHQQRKDYYNRMKIAPVSDLKEWDKLCAGLEFELQELLGFPMDVKYHKFWERPRCKCPRIDNEERIGTGYHIINEDCPLHGN